MARSGLPGDAPGRTAADAGARLIDSVAPGARAARERGLGRAPERELELPVVAGRARVQATVARGEAVGGAEDVVASAVGAQDPAAPVEEDERRDRLLQRLFAARSASSSSRQRWWKRIACARCGISSPISSICCLPGRRARRG